LTVNSHILRTYPLSSWAGIVVLGVLGGALVVLNDAYLQLPLFLDTIGTLVAAAAFGALPGAVTAIVTHLSVEVVHGFYMEMLPWVGVNIASAVVMGIMVQRGRFSTPVDAVAAIVLITLVNAVLGAIIAAVIFTGGTGHQVDYLVSSFIAIGQNLTSASFWARLPMNVIDKGIAVLIAYLVKLLWFDRWSGERPHSQEERTRKPRQG